MKRISRQLVALLGLVILVGGCARWEIDRMRVLRTKVRQQRENGQLDQALITAETMVKTRPEHHLPWWTLAAVHQERGEYAKAERAVRIAMEFAPESALPSLHAFLGSTYHRSTQYEKAVQQYQKTLELAPEYPGILPQLADALILAGKVAEAEETVDRALQEEPANPLTYVAAGQLHHDRGEPEQAIEAWREAVELDPRFFDARRLLARVLLEQGENDSAVEHLQALLEMEPEYRWALRAMGDALADTRTDEALEYHRKAHEVEPSHGPTFVDLIDILISAGESAEALKWLREDGDMASDEYQAWVCAAEAMAMIYQGRMEEAREVLAEVPAVPRDETWIHVWLATNWIYLGEFQRARREAVRIADGQGSLAWAWTYKALAFALNGDVDSARRYARWALRDGTYPAASAILAYVYALEGEHAEATRELENVRGLTGDPHWIDDLYLAGLAYRELGEIEKSNELFQRAIDRWPKHPWSERMRKIMAQAE